MTVDRTFTARRTWLTPVLILLGLAFALPSIYLAGTSDPQGHLSGLPVALVVEPQQGSATPGAAEQVAAAVEQEAGDALTITRMSPAALDTAMAEDRVAGAVVVPADFDVAVASLQPGSAEPHLASVAVLTNAGDGGLSAGLLSSNLAPLLQEVAASLGRQLVAGAGDRDLAAADELLLSEPFRTTSGPYRPLPDHAGLGTSAFYYALVLVLLGFMGASLVNPLIDAALGFVPGELGPLVARRPYTRVSRRATFLAKVAVLVGVSPLAALAAELVAGLVGVSTTSPVTLWAYSTVVIAAIGTSALAVFAALGSGIGALVNTLFFVALSMVSSGGTVPLEAAPGPFRWFSVVAPFRHVVDGTRSIFYFDADLGAGLGGAWLAVAVGGAIGLALGLVVTSLYGRVPAFSRHPR